MFRVSCGVVAALALALASVLSGCGSPPAAQFVDSEVDWKEAGVPDAPDFDVGRLIPLDAPRGSALSFGIDPGTISIGNDGVVRYVVVASSASGATNALFEGIRCSRGEYRLYARHNPEGGWTQVKDSDWESLFGSMPSRHPLAVAQAGVCVGRAPNGPLDVMLRTLRGTKHWRRGPI
ncbi:MAG: CNP1-like family protein [Burkholderiales bacterium]